MFLTAESNLNALALRLRESVWGRIQVRRGLPDVSHEEARGVEREREFYKLVLNIAEKLWPCPTESFRDLTTVIDVGCRNWSYVKALADTFPKANLYGIEVDGARRYWNLYRRMDYAQAYAQALNNQRPGGPKVQCSFGDFRRFKLSSALPNSMGPLFCFFYPFVSPRPCLKWGLPLAFADFEDLLKCAERHTASECSDAQRTCWVLSVHQGDWEAELAREAYKNAGFTWKDEVISPSSFRHSWPSEHPAHLFLGQKRPIA